MALVWCQYMRVCLCVRACLYVCVCVCPHTNMTDLHMLAIIPSTLATLSVHSFSCQYHKEITLSHVMEVVSSKLIGIKTQGV